MTVFVGVLPGQTDIEHLCVYVHNNVIVNILLPWPRSLDADTWT